MTGNTVEQPGGRCVILSACAVSAEMARYLKAGDCIIACDAGYRNAAVLGCRPALIVGDFDSAPKPDWPDVITLPHVKDDTDTQYAADYALKQGAKQVVMLGALGGVRMEHTLANLGTGLYLQKRGVDALIADEHSEVRFLLPGVPLTLQREQWNYFSLFPMEGRLEGVNIRDAFYPLENALLTADYPLGVSNEFRGDSVCISCTAGCGVVVLTKE